MDHNSKKDNEKNPISDEEREKNQRLELEEIRRLERENQQLTYLNDFLAHVQNFFCNSDKKS